MTAHLALVPTANVEGWQVYADADSAPWVRDLDLAERAELAVPRDVRRTIKGCLKSGVFHAVGGAHTVQTALVRTAEEIVVGGNGATQTVTAYYLNREAALLLLMRLDTPKARELQSVVVRVFLAVADGTIAPSRDDRLAEYCSRTTNAIERMTESQALLVQGQSENRALVLAAIAEARAATTAIQELRGEVTEKFNAILPRRRDAAVGTRLLQTQVVVAYYSGMCPCCGVERIITADGERLSICVTDHNESRQKNGKDKVWPVCKRCNQDLEREGRRATAQPLFASFQMRQAQLLQREQQPSLFRAA